MESSFWLDTMNPGWSIVYNEASQVIFPNKIVFLSLKIVFVLTNSVYSDEMPHCAAFHLGIHFLLKSAFMSH